MNSPTEAFENWKKGLKNQSQEDDESAFRAGYEEASEGIIGLLEGRIVPVDSIEDVGTEARYGQLRHNQALTDAIQAIRSFSANV